MQESQEIKPFEASDYLDSPEVIAEYLRVALENPNPNVLRLAVRDVVKALEMRSEPTE